jgi:hypothetical protein
MRIMGDGLLRSEGLFVRNHQNYFCKASPTLRRAVSSASRDHTCAICNITALVCSSVVVRAISKHRAANRRYSWVRPMPTNPYRLTPRTRQGGQTFPKKVKNLNAMKRLGVPDGAVSRFSGFPARACGSFQRWKACRTCSRSRTGSRSPRWANSMTFLATASASD